MGSIKRLCDDYIGLRPSIAILRIKQGIVEIFLRIALIVLAFLVFIPGAVLNTNLNNINNITVPDIKAAVQGGKPGVEWIMVVCWVAVFWQTGVIVLRFLNLEVIEKYIGFFILFELVVQVLFIISWFVGAIFFAVQSSQWTRLKKANDDLLNVPFTNILSSVAATSSFCFFSLPVDITLAVWLVMWLLLKWQKLITDQLRYRPGPISRDNGEGGLVSGQYED